MGLITAKCTQCGANIKVDDTKESGVCEFCGTEFITEKVINHYQISADNIIVNGDNINLSQYDIESALKAADKFMAGELYSDAEELLRQIIQNCPYDYRGWWQMALIAYHRDGLWFDDNKNYKKALALANDPEKLKAYRDKEFSRIEEAGKDIVKFCKNPNKNKLHKIYVSVGGTFDPYNFLCWQYLGLEVIDGQLTQVSYTMCNGRYVRTVMGPVTLRAQISASGSKILGCFYDENDKRIPALYISNITEDGIAFSGISPKDYNKKCGDRIRVIRGDAVFGQHSFQARPMAAVLFAVLAICISTIFVIWIMYIMVT